VPPTASVPAPDAIRLIDRRAELLSADPAAGSIEDTELRDLTKALRTLLAGAGLAVRRIRYETSPNLAERLARSEPIHPVSDQADLLDRLDIDRRCYVIEHPDLPDRPLNVLWGALRQGLTGCLDDILDTAAATDDPHAADTAVFYSIWLVEPGLVGLGRGEDLLVGAVDLLREELPNLTTFATLSPVLRFRRWIERHRPDQSMDADALERSCVEYLTTLDEGWRPVDPVARFHLGNGARLVAVHANGDRSARGWERSFGVMANYRYDLEDRDANLGQLGSGTVPVSDEVAALIAAPTADDDPGGPTEEPSG